MTEQEPPFLSQVPTETSSEYFAMFSNAPPKPGRGQRSSRELENDDGAVQMILPLAEIAQRSRGALPGAKEAIRTGHDSEEARRRVRLAFISEKGQRLRLP